MQPFEEIVTLLIDLVHRWHRAIAERDTDTLDRLWDDSYVSVTPGGELITKQDELATITDPDLEFASLTTADLQVRVYGDTAVVLGRSVAEGRYKDQNVGGAYRFTTVFIRRGSDWCAVVSQGTAA